MLIALAWILGAALADPGEPRIGQGDEVEIVLHGHTLSQNSYVVGSSGEIGFPYIGRIQLAGLTVFEAEEALQAALMDGYILRPQVSVRVQKYRSQRVVVLGSVGRTGEYTLDGPTTLRALIAQAGGAVLSRLDGQSISRATGFVDVSRRGENFRFALEKLDGEDGEFLVMGGDVIEVSLGQNVFLAGEVQQPGAVMFVPGLTVTQALLQAGGKARTGRLSGAYIVRNDERIRVNLRRVIRGREADVEMQPGDRLFIPISAI